MVADTEGRASIPRMRTAAKIVAEIKAADPGTEVTEYYICLEGAMFLQPGIIVNTGAEGLACVRNGGPI